MKIAVIGAVTWGIALSKFIIKNNHDISIWVYFEELKNQLSKDRVLNTLPNVKIPDGILFTCDYAKVLSYVNIILIAVASPYIRTCISDMKKYISDNTIIICVDKGIEKETMKTMSEVIEDELNTKNINNIRIVALSGLLMLKK